MSDVTDFIEEGTATKMAEELLGWMKAGADVVAEEAPHFAEEIIKFGVIENFSWMIIFWTVVAVVISTVRNYIKRERDVMDDEDRFFLWGIVLVVSVFPFFMGFDSFLSGMKAVFAPRLYLLEALSKLL